MDFSPIFKFINIDTDFYNLILNYEKNPAIFEKEIIAKLISKTLFNKEAIKILSNDYKNSSILKEYIGSNEKTAFDLLIQASEATESSYFYQVYSDIIMSKNVSVTIKQYLLSSILQLRSGHKRGYSHKITESQKNFGEKILNYLIIDFKFYTLTFDDVQWFETLSSEFSEDKLFETLKTLFEETQSSDFDINKNKNKLASLIKIYYTVANTMKDEKSKVINSKKDFDTLFMIGMWFVDNLIDYSKDVAPKRLYDKKSLLYTFSFINEDIDFITYKTVLELLEIDLDSFKKSLNKYQSSNIVSPYFKYFKNTEFHKIALEVFFAKANQQIDELEILSKHTLSMNMDEVKSLLKFMNGSFRHNTEKTFLGEESELVSILKKLPNYGHWREYNSFTFENDYQTLIVENSVEFNKILDRVLSDKIDFRNIFLLNNWGNSFKYTFVDSIIHSFVQYGRKDFVLTGHEWGFTNISNTLHDFDVFTDSIFSRYYIIN